jgi:hypothetical protein
MGDTHAPEQRRVPRQKAVSSSPARLSGCRGRTALPAQIERCLGSADRRGIGDPVVVGRSAGGTRLSARQGGEFTARRRRAERGRRPAGRSLRLLAANRTGEPAARLCHRPHVAARLPVPATGGGLCQLSNALYDAALQAGCEIVERHAHSRIVVGSAAATGRDATVAWNYVDLRFRPHEAVRIEARVTRDALVIRLHARSTAASTQSPWPPVAPAERTQPAAVTRSCATCGETACFQHEHRAEHGRAEDPDIGRCAFLVDENWPELQEYVGHMQRPTDVLGLPLDGATWRLPRYHWQRQGFAQVGSAPLQALRRAIAVRRAPAQGSARREAEQIGAQRIAARCPACSPQRSRRLSSPNRCCPSCGARVIWADARSMY